MRDCYELIRSGQRAMVRRYQRRHFGAFGAGSSYDPITSSIQRHDQIYVGRGVFIGRNATISTSRPVVIGDDTAIGPLLCVQAGDHDFETVGALNSRPGQGRGGPVTIGRNVWVGARVTVLKGVTIGDGAVVAAGSVVTRDVRPYTVVAGVPARFVRERFLDDEDRERHRRIVESELSMPDRGAA